MMPDIRPIETIFHGHHFRSRLEARWALFMYSLGIEFRYETEGFELADGTWYLPDFLIPSAATGHPLWLEIKPFAPTDEEINKAQGLSELLSQDVVILFGDIPGRLMDIRGGAHDSLLFRNGLAIPFEPRGWWAWWSCTCCGSAGFATHVGADKLCQCEAEPWDDLAIMDDAYFTASSARFDAATDLAALTVRERVLNRDVRAEVSNVSCVDLISRDVQLRRVAESKYAPFLGDCPHGHSDANNVLCVFDLGWYCYRCGIGGDNVDYLVSVRGVSIFAAVRSLHSLLGGKQTARGEVDHIRRAN